MIHLGAVHTHAYGEKTWRCMNPSILPDWINTQPALAHHTAQPRRAKAHQVRQLTAQPPCKGPPLTPHSRRAKADQVRQLTRAGTACIAPGGRRQLAQQLTPHTLYISPPPQCCYLHMTHAYLHSLPAPHAPATLIPSYSAPQPQYPTHKVHHSGIHRPLHCRPCRASWGVYISWCTHTYMRAAQQLHKTKPPTPPTPEGT